MEDSNSKNKSFPQLYELYIKTKIEINCQHEKGDKCEHFYYEPVLQAIENKLKNEEINTRAHTKLIIMKASLIYEHAKILTTVVQDTNENLDLQLLKDSLNLIEAHKNNYEVVYLYLRILNLLAYTLTKTGKLEEGLKVVQQAESLYEDIKDKAEILVFNTDELFQNVYMHKRNNVSKLEKLVTNNYQIQSWIYNKTNESKKFLKYHHIVLKRQLETQDGNALVWFYKCSKLGIHFFSNNKFVEGKHHLAAACSVLREYELELLKHRSEKNFYAQWNHLQKYYADLGKYWSKYALYLFNASRHLASNVNTDVSIKDILLQSFMDNSPASGPAREWFNIKKKSSNETLDAKNCQSNLIEEFSEENEKPQMNNLVRNMQDEIAKLNEAENDAEGITDMTKSILEALDDRQKEVEEKEVKADGDHSLEQNDSKINAVIKQNVGDQNEDNPNEETGAKESSETETNKKDSQTSNYSDAQSTTSKTEDEIDYEFKFPLLDLSSFDTVPNVLIDNTNSARQLFIYIQEWIKRSKLFYSMEDYPYEHVQLILDLNELYRYLSLYETNLENQYDVQRRRVELLEELSAMLKEVCPQTYLFLSIELLQELMQAQIDLLMLNIRRLTNVQSSGSLLLKDLCQEHNDTMRKMEALVEIQRRLGRKDTRLSLVDMQLFG